MQQNNKMDDKEYSTGVLVRRFLPYFQPYRRTLCADLCCAALTTMCEIVLPLIIRQITNTALEDVALLTARMVLGLALLYFVLRIIDALANYYMADMGHVMGARIETDMRRDAYAHLQLLSNTYFNNTKVGQIMGRITNDLFEVTEFSHHCPEEFFIAGIKIVISFVILAQIHLPLTLMIFVFVPVMTIVCRIINKKMRRTFSAQRHQIGELNAKLEDSLLGQKVVKAFTNEALESEKFEQGNQDFLKVKQHSYMLMGIFSTSTRVFDGLMYLTIIVGGGFFLMEGRILPGDMVAYSVLALHGMRWNALDEEEIKLRYQVPYVIWANYDIGQEQGADTSVNYLAADVLSRACVPTDAYHDFLLGLKKEYPVISTVRTVKADGSEVPSSGEAGEMDVYRKLQYYRLFDGGGK